MTDAPGRPTGAWPSWSRSGTARAPTSSPWPARSRASSGTCPPTSRAGRVKDNVAHTAHLEAVLAGAPEETIEVAEAPHLKGLMSYYTEQGVLARRDRDMESLADEIEQAVATRYAALQAEPPTDGAAAPPKTPGDVPWDNQTLLSNRPVDVWMHEQDIRRAIGRPGRVRRPRRRTRARHLRPRAADGRRQARRAAARDDGPRSRSRRPAGLDASASATTAEPRRSTTTAQPTTTVTPEPRGLRGPRRRPTPARGDPAARSRATRRSPGGCSSRWRSPRERGGLDAGRHPRPDRQACAGHRA